MTWVGIGGAAAGAVVGGVMNSGKGGSQTNGGAGTQTVNRDPWGPAQSWMTSNLASGQALQNAYANQPFSALQNQAYQNQNNQSAYMHGLVPNLLGQMSGQQVGFDRSNPNARPTAFNFGAANNAGQQSASAAQAAQAAAAAQAASQPQGLGLLNMAPATAPLNLNANTPQPVAQPASKFTQQGQIAWDPWNVNAAAIKAQDTGGYGSFHYGDQPTPGTQAYYDMQQYKQYGGADPDNIYGWNPPAAQVQPERY